MSLMKRTVTVNLNQANTGKISKIREFLSNYTVCVNQFIDVLWEIRRFNGKFVERELLDKVQTLLGACAKQSCAQMALHIVKSQRKKKQKTKPIFSSQSFDLDSRFIEIKEGKNSFDLWIKLHGIGNRTVLYLPSRRHKQFLKFSNDGWSLKQCGRIRIVEDKLFLDVFFDKETPELQEGKAIGLDCGYRKLAVLSTGQIAGGQIIEKIDKISRKLQNSKAFKRALIERNEYINREIKKIDLTDVQTVVVEALKDVKHKTKGKISTKVMSKLQRWVYSRFYTRLRQHLEVCGVHCQEVDPAYTSQTCNKCGDVHRENRNRELFKCTRCGYAADADYNASLNILNRFLLQEFSDPVRESCCLGLPSA